MNKYIGKPQPFLDHALGLVVWFTVSGEGSMKDLDEMRRQLIEAGAKWHSEYHKKK